MDQGESADVLRRRCLVHDIRKEWRKEFWSLIGAGRNFDNLLTFDGVFLVRELRDHFGLCELVHISQGNIANQQQTDGVRWCGTAVIRRFRNHIGEVDTWIENTTLFSLTARNGGFTLRRYAIHERLTFPKHVSCDRSFGRSDSETLGYDSGKIGETATMP